jgi:peptide/nickel transport system ATP-binding protein
LCVENLVVEYATSTQIVHAVSDVSLSIARGETFSLVGESGCGKSTLARAVMQLTRTTSGRVRFDDLELTTMHSSALRRMRHRLQIIFQDPVASLNPRRRIGAIVAEPLLIAGVRDRADRAARTRKVLRAVGLDPDLAASRFPNELSGGQCQRVCIARALVLNPELLVCDEPVSSLDVSIRAQIINLLESMKAAYGLTLLFIAHDLAVVKAVSDRVAVMYLGKLCEVAPTEQLFRSPGHPYTAMLLEAIPHPDPDAPVPETIPMGEPPSPMAPPSGCRFRTAARAPKPSAPPNHPPGAKLLRSNSLRATFHCPGELDAPRSPSRRATHTLGWGINRLPPTRCAAGLLAWAQLGGPSAVHRWPRQMNEL